VAGSDHQSAFGSHDLAYVGGMTDSEFEAVANLNPQIWLYRYKRGYMARTDPHSRYQLDNTRGWVHPSHWVSGAVIAGRNFGGGRPDSRFNGAVKSDRPSEWVLTNSNRYDGVFDPSVWFTATDGVNPLKFPVQPIPGSNGTEVYSIGKSGQGSNNTGDVFDITDPKFMCTSQTKGVQKQWFAFAYVTEPEPGKFIQGPMSNALQASVFPKVKANYATPPLYARGRKIKLLHK
jgi:hypothetical protein